MKSGFLVGGIAIGALIGIGVGYLLGTDAEKRNQWMKVVNSKLRGHSCDCDDDCGCGCKEGDCTPEQTA